MASYSRLVHATKHNLADERTKILVAVSAGWFLSIGVRLVYPILLPFFRDEFDFSLTISGLLLTVLWFAYSIGQVPGGVLADKVGEGITMVVSMVIAAAMITIIVVAPSEIVLFGGTALLGVAIALFGVVRLTSLADIYPENVGTAYGFLGSIGDIGSLVLPPLAGYIAAIALWQIGLGFLIPLYLLVAATIWIYVPGRTSPARGKAEVLTLEGARDVIVQLRHRSLVLGTILSILVIGIFQAFVGFFPTYLIEEKDLSPQVASGLFATFFVLGILIRPVAGNAYDRIGVRRLLLFMTAVSAVGLFVLPFHDDVIPLAVTTIVISFMIGNGTIATAYLTVSLPREIKNTGLGILRTVIFALAAASPVIFGVIADLGYFDEVFVLLSLLSVATMVVVLGLPPTRR